MASRINPFKGVFSITPGATLAHRAVGLWVGTGGDLVVTCPDGSTATLKNVPSGYEVAGEVISVDSGTTAADIVGYRYYV